MKKLFRLLFPKYKIHHASFLIGTTGGMKRHGEFIEHVNKENIEIVLSVVEEGLLKMIETNDHHNFCIDRYWCKLPNLLFFKKKLIFQRPSFSNLTKQVNFHLD